MHGRRTWYALLVILATAVLWIGTRALAQTPHSVQKTCGYQGGSACPQSPPATGPWQYEVSPNGWPPPNSEFHSFGDISAWIGGYWAYNSGVCSATVTSETEDNGAGYTVYNWGILREDFYVFSANVIAYSQHGQASPPWCASQWNTQFDVWILRTVACPPRMTVTYNTSPSTGPYCTLPSTYPLFQKQVGQSCPNGCGVGSSNTGGATPGTGSTVAGDPVNVSTGNLYQSEADYAGSGQNSLKFVRSYNSMSAYAAWGWSSAAIPPTVFIGSAWSATYFQRLVPMSVTDSTTTYNSVYAYRPDGRVLIFSEYNGVYSPDGDVSDALIQTAGLAVPDRR